MKAMQTPRLFRVARLLVCCLLAGCATKGPGAGLQGSSNADVVVFEDVNVLSMVNMEVQPHQSVLIKGGRITQVGPAGSFSPPDGSTVIPAAGRYLMPGMMDLHVHLPTEPAPGELERLLDLFLASGVTSIRSMRGAPAHLQLRERLRAAAQVAPTLYLSGPSVTEALTPEQAAELVSQQKAAGYDFIKLLGGLERAAYDALAARAGELGIAVSGHVPPKVGIDAALEARQRTIEHLMGYDAAAKAGPEALDELARRTQAAGVCNCPTLDFFAVALEPSGPGLIQREGLRYATAQELEQWQKEKQSPPSPQGEVRLKRNADIVAALSRANALLVVGSDSPGTYRVPGFSYVEELRRMTLAGLSNAEVLRAATRSAAECLGVAEQAGTVAPGMRADLVLLEHNPLEDVRNVARPAGVMVGGRWLPREQLDQRLEQQLKTPAPEDASGGATPTSAR